MVQGENTVSSNIDTVKILNEDTYNVLNNMLSSSDEADHKMAQLLLVQIDVNQSIYYLWKLAKKHAHRMVNLRTKLGKKFVQESSIFGLQHKTANEFAIHLKSKNLLTPSLYALLVKDIKADMKYKLKHAFYDVHVVLKPKYKDLDSTDQLEPVNNF